MHCRTLRSIPDLDPLEARSTSVPPAPPAVTTKNISRHCQAPRRCHSGIETGPVV